MDKKDALAPSPGDAFGSVYVHKPTARHTHTSVVLHGRGSTGEEFAEEFLEAATTGNMTLPLMFPGWWVFPSSKTSWSDLFKEQMPSWLEAYSLAHSNARQDLQMDGIKKSVAYIGTILERESEMLHGRSENLVLGGISQGAAIGMWTLMYRGNPNRQLGAFVGASSWLPFASTIEDFVVRGQTRKPGWKGTESDVFVEGMMAAWKLPLVPSLQGCRPLLSTPVFLGHGTDDAYVDIELGQQAKQVLVQAGFNLLESEASHSYPSLSSQSSMETRPASTNPEGLYHSLSNSWASYLVAQHNSREVTLLKGAVDGHTKQVNALINSLQNDLARNQQLVTAAFDESKARSEQITFEVNELKPLRCSLPLLKQEVDQDKEEATKTFSELAKKLTDLQQDLVRIQESTLQSIEAIRGQNRSIISNLSLVEAEMVQLRAEKLLMEQRISVLDRKLDSMDASRQEIPPETVSFINKIFLRSEKLMKLLDYHEAEAAEMCATQPDRPKRTLHSYSSRDFRRLYRSFNQEYKNSKPISEVGFIWKFIDSIDNPGLSRHIQESLAASLPEYIYTRKETRRPSNQHHINISAKLSWDEFKKALAKTAAM
ncbi:Alpha/Beta hydrolase protein [Lasiosphaeria miniovina]|uniref:Alpha/Beta hydrolase protein n=1 Tax=Lasiosphaeria miniovina TaxID=1954250 RepID=A0AA40DHW8_9PEZI|nr:Alpha/Beta hydrolase protein [Lasiosphaeria miniovina]KAK0703775.1 Alpha/Beta hydrolase protein [Lasiosphaeria miniovina]